MNLEQTYNTNMKLLKEGWFEVYTKILNADISNYKLEETISGEYNISVNNKNLYPNNINESIENQVDTFLKNPISYFKKPSWSKDMKRDYLHDKIITDIEESSPYVKEKIPFSNYHHNLNGHFPLLILIGIGSGQYIEKLIDKANGINDIIIIDQNYDFLKISLHLVNWEPIFKYFFSNNKSLHFVINDDYKKVSNSTLNVIFKHFPYHFYNIPYLTHYNSKFFNILKEEFLSKINLGFTGLGFYDDEIDGLTHTIKNINNKRPVYRNTVSLDKNTTAFVIASGPSIDRDIEHIKKHQDTAIIFSCGTALKILYKNGIIPDFHIEQERTKGIIHKILLDNFPPEYLKEINLIALNVVQPIIFDLFKTAKIYFRENDAGSSIVPNDIPKLEHCNPTVTNATTSLVSSMGFKNIYLFGADMGFDDSENHHSKDTIYYDNNRAKVNLNINKETYPGNFDKNTKFLSTNILFWCKQRMENCIIDYTKFYKDKIYYYNCSNGLFIEGTIPLLSENINISKTINKNNILSLIDEMFDDNFMNLSEEIEKKMNTEKITILSNINSLKKLIKARKINSFEQFFVLIKRTFTIISMLENTNISSLTRSLLKGTIYHLYVSTYTHALAGTNKEESIIYINNCLKKLLSFLDIVVKEINNFKLIK